MNFSEAFPTSAAYSWPARNSTPAAATSPLSADEEKKARNCCEPDSLEAPRAIVEVLLTFGTAKAYVFCLLVSSLRHFSLAGNARSKMGDFSFRTLGANADKYLQAAAKSIRLQHYFCCANSWRM
jgi:hypothetical protein